MPSTTLRQQVLANTKSVVVKLGSQLFINQQGGADMDFLCRIAQQVVQLVERGIEVTLVSSGAVGVGRQTLGLTTKPDDVALLQAVSAIGQSGLMDCWTAAFEPHHLHVAQILLTRDDIEDRRRYLNFRNCIFELHKLGAVPIVNENDTVSVDEIRLGDNDVLAAVVTNTIRADAMILLTGVDGLHDKRGQVLEMVSDIKEAQLLVREEKSELGSGGMATKLEAAQCVTDAGEIAVMANGREPDILLRLFKGEKLGTIFTPAKRRLTSRDRWIALAVRPTGEFTVDDGAAKAVSQHGKSLLASGVTQISGDFDKGDVIVIYDMQKREIARGLTNYSAAEARLIIGKKTNEFEAVLGREVYDCLIHRDHLVLAATR